MKASSYVDREAWAGVENAEEAVLKVRGKSLKSSGQTQGMVPAGTRQVEISKALAEGSRKK